jgi:hypothetical protein
VRGLGLLALLSPAICLAAGSVSPPASPGECAVERGGVTLCLYRSLLPSSGIVASCREGDGCRVGHYHGNPTDAVWFTLPPGMATLPRPEVFWLTSTLAQVSFGCGHPCSWSYFFEATRGRVSEPWQSVLAADPRRLLIALPEERALVARQMFSGREVARIERDWAPDSWLGDVIMDPRFGPDGRLSFTWLRGKTRTPVSERVSIPSVPHSRSEPRPHASR